MLRFAILSQSKVSYIMLQKGNNNTSDSVPGTSFPVSPLTRRDCTQSPMKHSSWSG